MGALTDRRVTAQRVRAITYVPMDDALRNHLITLAYMDMGTEMAGLVGRDDANWTSLAVWPSFTVGETIRATGDPIGLKRIFRRGGEDPVASLRTAMTGRINGTRTGGRVLNRSLAAGNRGVFYEIGICWADFLATFADQASMSEERIVDEFRAFCDRIDRLGLPPGKLWPDGNREQLKRGFAAYLEAMGLTDNPNRRAELILLANICIGDHEQRRLQGWLDLSLLEPIRLAAKPLRPLGADALLGGIEKWWSRTITRQVFVVKMAGETIRVGKPVPGLNGVQYPAPLDVLEHPDVAAEFDRVVSSGGGAARGATYWTDINDRMSFIASLFRARQRAGLIGVDPYPPGAQDVIWAEAAKIDAQDAAYEFEGPLMFPKAETSPFAPEMVRDLVERLDAGRQQCDDPVDSVVEQFYRTSGIVRTDRHFTDILVELAGPMGPGPGPIGDYLRAEPQLPEWADLDRVLRAQEFFHKSRAAMHASMFFGSMFLGYAAGNGVQVLALVSDLTQSPERRIWESTRFVEDISTTPFWERGSAGWKSIRGVRLFHASVRATIESGSQHIKPKAEYPTDRVWDPAWGRPINQEDTFGYALTMAIPVIENLDRMGIAFTPEEAGDYLHMWQVIGVLMGVDDAFFRSPLDQSRELNFEEARYVLDIILARNVRPTEAGRQLTAALMEQIGWFPGPMRRVARAFIRSSIGDRNADLLGVPQPGLLEPGLSAWQNLARTLRTNKAYASSSRAMGTWLGEQFVSWWEKEYRDVPPFRQGGHQAVAARAPDPATRLPRQVTISIDSLADLPPNVLAAVHAVTGVSVASQPVEDHGYERVGMQTLLAGTAADGAAVADLIGALRASTQTVQGLRRVEVVIDGRTIPLSAMTNAEVEALLPELAA